MTDVPVRSFIIIFALCVLVFSPVTAEDSGEFRYDKDSDAYVYATSITVEETRRTPDHGIDELPAFVTRITVDPDVPRFQTVPEVLSSTVGVTVRDFGGLGALSTVSIRGSSSSQVLVLMDGIRLNTASGLGVDLSNISLDNIERIEVLRGADSAVYGDGAMGGVVNLISRTPDRTGWSVNGRFDAGEFNTWRTNLECLTGAPGWDVRVSGYHHRSDGDFTFINDQGTPDTPEDDFEDVRTNNAMETTGGTMRVRRDFNTDWTLTGSVEGFYSRKGIPGMVRFPSDHAEQVDRRLASSWLLQGRAPGTDNGSVSIELNGMRSGLNFDDPLGEQTGVPVHTRQRTLGLDSRFAYRNTWARHGASFTGAYRYESLNDDDFEDPLRRTWSIALKDDFEAFRETVWLTGIIRYDDISDTGSRFSPKLGIKWFLSPSLAVKANAGTGYRSPSFNELFMNMGYISGNPDLKPEKNRSYDVGISFEKTRFRTELALFQTDTEDLIQYVLVSGFRYKPYNIGKARSRGTELNLSWNPWKSIHLSTAYTYMEAVNRSDNRNTQDKQIPGRPEHQWFSRLEWTGNRLTLFTEWRYVSGNYVTASNTKKLPDRRTGNAGVQYRVTDYLLLGVEVKNFTDSQVVDIRGFPLPPRTVFGSVRVVL